MPHDAAFAVPGDLNATTGGYHYDRSLIEAVRRAGHGMRPVVLPGDFPFPTATEMARATDMLAALPGNEVVIIDGLAFGALPDAAVARIAAPIVALVHHPLAHESYLPPETAARLAAQERRNLARAAHVIVPSPHIRDVLLADYGVAENDVTVLRPGRSGEPRPSTERAKDDPPLILSVGLLHPRKGHDTLVDALAMLGDLDWHAVIVGTPWQDGFETRLRDRIAGAGLTDRVEIAGRVPDDRLRDLYDRAHLFALATRYEGYGIVFDEALLNGLPIVATTAGAVPGTVPPDAGRLVPPDDPAAFATALRGLLSDPVAHAGAVEAARSAARSLPSWDDTGRELLAVLDRVTGRAA